MQPDNPTPNPECPFLRGIQALADYLGVSDKTVTRAMRRHLLPFVRLGGTILFRRADVEDALERLTVPAVGSGKRTARKEVANA